AFGNLGRDIELARTGLRDTAGPLAAPERLALGVEQLADMVARRRSGSTIQPEPRYRGLGAGAGAPAMPERRLPTTAPAGPPPPAATPAPRPAHPSRPAYPPTYQPVRPSMPGVIGEDREPILAGRTRLIAGAVALLLIFALGAGGVWAARGLLAQPTTTAVN